MEAENWVDKEIDFANKHLLHMRPAQRIVEEAQKFKAELRFSMVGEEIGEEWNPKSILEMLMFSAEIVKSDKNSFRMRALGEDAETAIGRISDFVASELFLGEAA